MTPFDLCEGVRTAVLAALHDAARPAIGRTYSGVGLTAWDEACGQLVVSPGRSYLTRAFPGEWTGDEAGVETIAVPIEVLLVRCVPTPDDRGNPPTDEALTAAHRDVLDDAAVIWNVAVGPMEDLGDRYGTWERSLVSQEYVGPEGGAIGVLTRLTVGLPLADWCTT